MEVHHQKVKSVMQRALPVVGINVYRIWLAQVPQKSLFVFPIYIHFLDFSLFSTCPIYMVPNPVHCKARDMFVR